MYSFWFLRKINFKNLFRYKPITSRTQIWTHHTTAGANALTTLISSVLPSLIPLSYNLSLLIFLLHTMTRPWAGKSGLRLRREKEFSSVPKLALGPVQPPTEWAPEVKLAGGEADHTSLFSVKVEIEWNYTSVLYIWFQDVYKKNFTLRYFWFSLMFIQFIYEGRSEINASYLFPWKLH